MNAVTAAASAPARPPAPASSLAFLAAPAQVGDRVVQRLGFRLQASTRVVQSGQVAHEGTHLMVRQQQRTIDVLSVDGGRAGKVRASFEISRRQSPEDGAPDELVKLPIEGRTYLMSRVGDEVQVADDRGNLAEQELRIRVGTAS